MKKLVGAAGMVALLLLVVSLPAHAWSGQGVQSSGPMSPHGVVVPANVPKAVVVAPRPIAAAPHAPSQVAPHPVVVAPHHRPVVVAPDHGFVRPRAFVGVGVAAPFGWPAYAYRYPAYAYAPPTVYVPPPEPVYWYYCPA